MAKFLPHCGKVFTYPIGQVLTLQMAKDWKHSLPCNLVTLFLREHSCSEDREFESRHRLLKTYSSHLVTLIRQLADACRRTRTWQLSDSCGKNFFPPFKIFPLSFEWEGGREGHFISIVSESAKSLPTARHILLEWMKPGTDPIKDFTV